MRFRVVAASIVLSLLIVITSGLSIEARQAGVPAAPALGAALVSPAAGGAIVGISWAFPAGSTATNIQIQAGSGPGLSDIAVASIAANPTAFSTFAPPGTYYVRLIAINAAGASAPSNEIIIFVGGDGGCQPPGIPTGLTATPGAGNVTLRWNPSAIGGAATGYSLLAGSFSGGVNLGTFPVGLQTTVTAPAPAGQYFVRVVASNACGSSAPSSETSFVIGGGGGGPIAVPAGTYQGTIANHNRFGLPPITSFTLRLDQQVPTGAGLQMISGRWQDNRGCIKTSGIFGGTPAAGPQLSIESLTCNDGDFGLRITSVNGQTYSGVCLSGGTGCTFQMTRTP